MIAAAAYINSYGTPRGDRDVQHRFGPGCIAAADAPNDGTLATIGMLNVENPGEMMRSTSRPMPKAPTWRGW